MAIHKRNNSWQVSVSVNGSRVRRSFRDRSDAVQFEADAKSSMLRGENVPTSSSPSESGNVPKTIGGMASHVYESEWKHQKSADHTYNRSQRVVDYFGEDRMIDSIDSYELEKYIIHLRTVDSNSPATINRKLAVLGKIFSYAERHGLINSKPVMLFQKEPPGRVRYYTPEEEKEIIHSLIRWDFEASDDMLCLFRLLLDTGMRKGEALSMTWGEVDWIRDMIVLRDPEKIKTSTPRSIPMTSRVKDVLQRRRMRQCVRPFDFSDHELSYWVSCFKDEVATSFSMKGLAFFHTCRHTFISRLVQRGVGLSIVKEVAGHKSITTTMRYAHLAPSNFKDAINLLEP